jgi:hypothetical protein
MKKLVIAAIILILILSVLGGLYWLGFLTFHDYIPSLTTNPGSSQSETSPATEVAPRLTIENVRGRINKISADIKNVDNRSASSVNWSISVTGGILRRIDLRSTGTISTLSAESTTTVQSSRIPFGFGRVTITVTAQASGGEIVTQTAKGFKFLFIVFGVRT